MGVATVTKEGIAASLSSMRMLLAAPPVVALTRCLASRINSMESPATDGTGSFSSRFDPTPRLGQTAFEQNATLKNTSFHEDPSLLKVGYLGTKSSALSGPPNGISDRGGYPQDVYEFRPDGSKFAKPKIDARNIAAGVFTGGIPGLLRLGFSH